VGANTALIRAVLAMAHLQVFFIPCYVKDLRIGKLRVNLRRTVMVFMQGTRACDPRKLTVTIYLLAGHSHVHRLISVKLLKSVLGQVGPCTVGSAGL